MSLACGGRGPCCHIGYSHRHCEHCDVVIPTHACHHHWYGGWQPNWAGYYSGFYNQNNTLHAQQSSNLLGALQQLGTQFNSIEYPEK